MSKLPSMPWFPADFFADTAHISDMAAHGYLFLLGHAWLRGGKLPDDDMVLARLARIRGCNWLRAKEEIMAFWELGADGFWRNKRLTKEYIFVTAKIEVKRANGSKETFAGKLKQESARLKFDCRWPSQRNNDKPLKYNNRTYANGPPPTPTPNKYSLNGVKGKDRETAELVFVKEETEQWNAWTEFYRNSKKPIPSAVSRKGTHERGWYFQTEWPPSMQPGTPQER